MASVVQPLRPESLADTPCVHAATTEDGGIS